MNKIKKYKDIIVTTILLISITFCLLVQVAINHNYSAGAGFFTALILALNKVKYVFKFHVHDNRKIYTEDDMIAFGYDCFASVYVDSDGDITYHNVPEELIQAFESEKINHKNNV